MTLHQTSDLRGARRGEPCVIPAGTPIHSTKDGGWKISTRKQTVTPHYVDHYEGVSVITWAGAGGYWRRVRLMPDDTFAAHWGEWEGKE